MNVRKLMYTGLCLSVAAVAFAGSQAWAVEADEDVVVTVSLPTPTLTLTPMSFGDEYMAVTTAGASVATAVLSTAGVLTHTMGTPGNARLIPIDTASKSPLIVDVVSGAPSATMSIQIEDGNTAAQPFILLEGAVPDADLRIDTWTSLVTAGKGTLTFTPATATGTATLNNLGEFNAKFGATLKTVTHPTDTYAAQDYTGNIKVTMNY